MSVPAAIRPLGARGGARFEAGQMLRRRPAHGPMVQSRALRHERLSARSCPWLGRIMVGQSRPVSWVFDQTRAGGASWSALDQRTSAATERQPCTGSALFRCVMDMWPAIARKRAEERRLVAAIALAPLGMSTRRLWSPEVLAVRWSAPQLVGSGPRFWRFLFGAWMWLQSAQRRIAVGSSPISLEASRSPCAPPPSRSACQSAHAA